ncbi:hypothetical protein GJ496_011122 [Pomphorhynchus laevis]|nr:hypothetical protein GJ496_011122 [Pomphorhynchus laevis]
MNLRPFACELKNVALCNSSNETTFRNGSLRILNETMTWIPKSNEKRYQSQIKSMKRMLRSTDDRLKDQYRKKREPKAPEPVKDGEVNPDKKVDTSVRELPKYSSAMFLHYNMQLGPPYHILVDTNFINFTIRNKLDMVQSAMDCLYAKCTIYVTDCVIGELQSLGRKYRMAIKIAKDSRFERLICSHKGIYADDCLVQRVSEHKCYIMATCDKDLKRRVRKIPGVPIMYIKGHQYTVERMPDAFGAPRM